MIPSCFKNLENVKNAPAGGGWQAACPVCRAEGGDSQKNHLRIWPSLAFSCAKMQGDLDHNRKIRRLIRGDNSDGSVDDIEIIDPEPTVDVDRVYGEDSLARLLPDYTYWVNRGIKESVLVRNQCGLASATEKSKLSGRAVFPCRNAKGQIVGWAGRIIVDNSFAPRWKILGKKASFVFPSPTISLPAIRETGELILVEGIGCSLALQSASIANEFVLFGTKLSSKLLSQIIALNPKRIRIATNNEASGIGQREAEKIAARLRSFFNEDRIVIDLPWSKDFAEMTEEDIGKWHRGEVRT